MMSSARPRPRWDPPPNPEATAINSVQLSYWRERGYTIEDCLSICKEADSQSMAALVSFSGEGTASLRVTSKTWSRQEGHYPTVGTVFSQLARHPMLRSLKGDLIVWLEDGMWPISQPLAQRAPILAFGRDRTDACTLLMPDPSFLGSAGYEDDVKIHAELDAAHPWSSRLAKAYWRGAATGLGIEGADWRKTARGKLVLLSRKLSAPDRLDAAFTRVQHLPREALDDMLAAGVVDDEVPFKEFFKYRYMVDADGYSCAWRSLFLKLSMGSVVLKVASQIEQWYHRRLVPGRHYIALKEDLSDFDDAHAWLQSNDEAAREIGERGAAFVRSLKLTEALDELAFYCTELLLSQREQAETGS